jgi:hypothetical protein
MSKAKSNHQVVELGNGGVLTPAQMRYIPEILR